MRPGGRIRRRIESAVTDLPQPLSPTMPSVSPPRTRRETRGISAMVMARMTFCTEPRVRAISAMASRMGGMDIMPSMTRMMMLSAKRMKPEIRPMVRPITRGADRHREADQQETRAP
jgi:hypothetical protein